MSDNTTRLTARQQLAAIEGLELGDCLWFFDQQATARDKQIAALADDQHGREGEIEVDNALTSEGDDNGSLPGRGRRRPGDLSDLPQGSGAGAMTATLRVGDTVCWRGAWGMAAPQRAVVVGIQVTAHEHQKYGEPVDSVPWTEVRRTCLSLDNGHWAYGDQIVPPAAGERTP